MKVIRNQKWTGGWFIGNFEPSAFKTDAFEVCLKKHEKGERWPIHYHKIATEINYLLKGKMTIQNETFNPGDVFVIEPNEIADPTFLEDCELIVVKTPFVRNDKYEVI
jgi:quercetin dioxygenase-like cupin family protein